MRDDTFLVRLRAALTPPDAPARVVWAAAILLVVARSLVFAFTEQAFFDSDQAVFGLMAKHLSEGRAFPLFMYGQNYILAVEAWMAAPLFLIGGPSVALLKLPLVIISAVIAAMLIGLLVREGKLSAWMALVASLFFILPPPGTAAQIVEASGGNLEPFLYILLLWIARRDPVASGAILALGFLHREFTIYAVFALIVVDARERTLFTRASLLFKARAALTFAAVWSVFFGLRFVSTPAGPGTSLADIHAPANNLSELFARFCGDAGELMRNVPAIYSQYLAYLFGLRVQPVADFAVNSAVIQGMRGLELAMGVLVGVCVLNLARRSILPRAEADAAGGEPGRSSFILYLGCVGVAGLIFYAWGRCGELSIFTLRYGLLGIFAMIALAASALELRVPRPIRLSAAALILFWALASAWPHAKILVEYSRVPPPNWRGILADYLVERGVRYAQSNYWTAYHVTFLSGERVIVGSTDMQRIVTYQRLLDEHRSEVWTITEERCAGGLQVIPSWYLCPPEPTGARPGGPPRP